MIVDTKDLNEAYKAYSSNLLMRKDLFKIIIDKVIEVETRLKAIEAGESNREVAFKALVDWQSDINHHLETLDDEIDTKVASAASSAVRIFDQMRGDAGAQAVQGGILDRPSNRGRPVGSKNLPKVGTAVGEG